MQSIVKLTVDATDMIFEIYQYTADEIRAMINTGGYINSADVQLDNVHLKCTIKVPNTNLNQNPFVAFPVENEKSYEYWTQVRFNPSNSKRLMEWCPSNLVLKDHHMVKYVNSNLHDIIQILK
jgi:hypothetical protein